jgi:predicted dehydrogenase
MSPVPSPPGNTARSRAPIQRYPMANTIPLSDVLTLEDPAQPDEVAVDCFARTNAVDVVRLGVIGFGNWGPNIVRNFQALERGEVVTICDRNPATLRRAARIHRGVQVTTDPCEVLSSPDIDAVAVITPVRTHFDLAKAALQHGKHVFVEKPFTATAAQAEELIELADRQNLRIMVDHTFLFSGAVTKIRSLLDSRALGTLYYFDSTRGNLGLLQHDINVVWDLAPHDLSILDHVIFERPQAVVTTGGRHVNGMADVAFITVYFPGNLIAHVNVNWLSPIKVRTTLIAGADKMLVWNDLEADEKLRIYDRGVSMSTNPSNLHQLLVSYRSGDMWAPQVEQVEALRAETAYFIKCIEGNSKPFNDGEAGLRVVRILEAADRSIRSRGEAITL